MSDETVGGTSSGTVATAPTGQVASVSSGTSENTGGQAGAGASGAPSEESFTAVDPTKLPPELQAHYKAMQADYTKKTMTIAEERKRFAEAEKKAKSYDQLTADQRYRDYLSELNRGQRADFNKQKAEAEQRLGEKITDVDFAKALESKDGFLELIQKVSEISRTKDQKKIESLEGKVGQQEAMNVIEQVATELDKSTKQLIRPDFNDLEEDRLISGYLSVNPARSPAEYKDRVTEAYNWAKQISSKYYEKGKAEALKIIQTKAANSSEPPTVTAKGAYTGPDPKKLDVAEAVAMARKGIRVPHS